MIQLYVGFCCLLVVTWRNEQEQETGSDDQLVLLRRLNRNRKTKELLSLA